MRLTILAVLIAFVSCGLTEPGRAAEGIAYSVSLKGVEDKALQRALLDHANLSTEKPRTFATVRALRRHIDCRLTADRAGLFHGSAVTIDHLRFERADTVSAWAVTT